MNTTWKENIIPLVVVGVIIFLYFSNFHKIVMALIRA